MTELLRYELSPAEVARWGRLRAEVRTGAGGRCRCCDEERATRMVCHELWADDDDAGSATLCAFRLICPECNLVSHRGMAGSNGLAERADAQLVRLNGVSLDEAHQLYDQAHAQWAERSARRWTVRIALELIERYPALAGVELAPQ